MLRKIFSALILCSSVFCSFSNAQTCTPPSIIANAKSENLFSAEQEMILGELIVNNMARDTRFVRDEKLMAYVNDINSRLTKHLPPTGLRFQFHLVDITQANAFNLPGGHIAISRKLVGFVNSEDELAGVIAHELGHAVVRHVATRISESLRKILKVTSLGDRKDITEKYNLLIERARTIRLPRERDHENELQLEADRIGLFAMAAAGYDPAAFFSFFDRLTESEGKTGSWFSDLFGTTAPEQKRLREMIHIIEQLPATCRDGRDTRKNEDFLKWQADVVSFREAGRKEELPGLIWKKELAPKLRSDISHLAFSQDGKLLLVQDDFAVTVIEREPQQVLFQIPVENAKEATFTPDGNFVVFTTENLRFEKWSVAEKKPIEVRELVSRRDCLENKLSPDGNYLVCIDTTMSASILETKTGKKIWVKKEFYQLSEFELLIWALTTALGGDRKMSLFRVEFSPDSRYVMFSRADGVRFGAQTAIALDLTTLKPTNLGGDLKKIAARPYIFLDSGRILGTLTQDANEGGIFSFPDGKRLQKFAFTARVIKRTSNPDYVIIKPLRRFKMGLFDLKKGIIASGGTNADAALWNNLMAFEAASGKIMIRETSYNEAEKKFDAKDLNTIEIPASSIRNLNAAEVSDNLNWLLLSSKTRGGLWNLESGERKVFVRGFRGGLVANDGVAIGDFPKLDDTKHSLVLMNPHKNQVVAIHELPAIGAGQHGRFVLLRSSLKDKRDESKNFPDFLTDDNSAGFSLRREVRFELKDIVSDKIIWSRDFPKEAPEFSFDEFSGRIVFYWYLGSDAGKAKLKENAELQAKAGALGKDSIAYLIEIVDAFAGKTVGVILLETGGGLFGFGEILSEGDWLVRRDSNGRVLVYSIRDGDIRHRFFGGKAALNPKRDQIAVENFSGEVAIYDLNTGDRHANFVISGGAAFFRFNLEGNKLFVLSDDQSAYAFDLNKVAAQKTTEAK
jgi:hypothetical protein